MKVFPRTLSLFLKKWVVQFEFDKVFRYCKQRVGEYISVKGI